MKLSCKEASRLLSQSMDREMSVGELARLRLHLMLCDACRNFERQLKQLRHAVMRLFEQ
ncbi:MAG TPA: zf-HC2 domain-containing protein [Burkholderiales bacterium]|nr:zf-HC2 domain-containing protein [Burkholderiales bacterium]